MTLNIASIYLFARIFYTQMENRIFISAYVDTGTITSECSARAYRGKSPLVPTWFVCACVYVCARRTEKEGIGQFILACRNKKNAVTVACPSREFMFKEICFHDFLPFSCISLFLYYLSTCY